MLYSFVKHWLDFQFLSIQDNRVTLLSINGEIKFDVTWSYVKRQTAKVTSEFVFFSSNPSLNHIKVEKCLLLFATNSNIFIPVFKELKTDGKSFIFAFSVRPRNVKLNLSNNLCRPSALLSTVFFSEIPYHVKSHCKLTANSKLLHLPCI